MNLLSRYDTLIGVTMLTPGEIVCCSSMTTAPTFAAYQDTRMAEAKTTPEPVCVQCGGGFGAARLHRKVGPLCCGYCGSPWQYKAAA